MVALVATIFIVVGDVLVYLPGHVSTCQTDRVPVAITLYAKYPVIGRLQHVQIQVQAYILEEPQTLLQNSLPGQTVCSCVLSNAPI